MLLPPAESGQYRAICYTERLEELGIVASMGSESDSFDNAPAKALNRVFKTELISRRGPWKTLEHVELETQQRWVDLQPSRPQEWCDYLAPAAYEHDHYAANSPSPATAAEAHMTLH
ncbi:hypothetical protein [Serinicoccus marinus]|uniref:hypothetical protein n=1 Tax=Serinicoccus marinus TaxID=247333 RepID=UPI0024901E1C|nr:hypothetical protein [Serinicoccus marinus]